MSKPSYLALAFWHLSVVSARTGEQKAEEVLTQTPTNLLSDAFYDLIDRVADNDVIRNFVMDVAGRLDNASEEDRKSARDFDGAEQRFLQVLLNVKVHDTPLFLNNLGKVGNDLGMRVPFFY